MIAYRKGVWSAAAQRGMAPVSAGVTEARCEAPAPCATEPPRRRTLARASPAEERDVGQRVQPEVPMADKGPL